MEEKNQQHEVRARSSSSSSMNHNIDREIFE